MYLVSQLFASVFVIIGILFMAMMLIGEAKGRERFTMFLMLFSGIIAFGFVWGWGANGITADRI